MVYEYDLEKIECEIQDTEEQMKELETKGHEEENLRIESDERNGQNVEKQMVNEYEMERGNGEDQETVKQIKKLETKEHSIEKQERKQQIENLIIENDGKKGLKIKRPRLEETMSEEETKNEQNEKANKAESLWKDNTSW
ncbi:unnamed protein product [Parnassius apollo]|uniref:(apollo) hypothetical protein n=1 Tax=Parnassius apollo TaxID=110799 RepID=A0A8S3XKJ8_PARAO|nr:unnamed protein product [Parnassius apollo]